MKVFPFSFNLDESFLAELYKINFSKNKKDTQAIKLKKQRNINILRDQMWPNVTKCNQVSSAQQYDGELVVGTACRAPTGCKSQGDVGNDQDRFDWRINFIRTFLEREGRCHIFGSSFQKQPQISRDFYWVGLGYIQPESSRVVIR